MLEKLAGRLKWEHRDQDIRIEIPARWGWQAIFAAAALVGGVPEVSQLLLSIPTDGLASDSEFSAH